MAGPLIRSLWKPMKASILFISYNHAAFVAKAIRSAMAQDHPDFQLVICEDASTDATRAILEEELKSCPPHIQLTWASPTKNVGLIANFNGGMAACTGDFIVVMSGDDISEPDRVSTLAKAFENPRCMLAVSDCTLVDTEDRVLEPSCIRVPPGYYAYGPRPRALDPVPTSGAAAAYRATLRDIFGPLEKQPYAEDSCYGIRAFLAGEVCFIARSLVRKRTHETNLCGATPASDTPQARKRHLRMYRAQCRDSRQWLADIRLAAERGMISTETAGILSALAGEAGLQKRLAYHSLVVAPWRIWRETARRFWGLHPSARTARRILRHFVMRLLAARRRRYWRKYFGASQA